MKTLTVRFDVTGWTMEQIETLAFEVCVQGEASEEHPESIPVHSVVEFASANDRHPACVRECGGLACNSGCGT